MSEPTEKRGRMNEKDQQIEKLRRLCKKLKDHNKRLFDDYSQVCVDQMNLRRQLDALGKEKAEKERELDNKDRRYEKMDEGYSHQIASLSMEVERLEGELDDLQLSTTPGFVNAMALIDEELTKGKLEIEKVQKVTKLLPNDAPTEAEVEKVAVELYEQHTTSRQLARRAFCLLHGDERIRWRSVARHVIERGYRRKE